MDLEREFWGNCTNTYGEETKQLLYMREMGFPLVRDWRSGFWFDFKGRSVVDFGGGPMSVLLKAIDVVEVPKRWVVDPMSLPRWVRRRYESAGIVRLHQRGEDFTPLAVPLDLALIYNCLQHVDDPEKVIANARACAKELRMFEWINIPPHDGHPHMLTADMLERAAGERGVVKHFHGENECAGTAWILGGG